MRDKGKGLRIRFLVSQHLFYSCSADNTIRATAAPTDSMVPCRALAWLLEKIMRIINRNAYVIVAAKGTGYCHSASRAVSLLLSNVLRVATASAITAAFIWYDSIGLRMALLGLRLKAYYRPILFEIVGFRATTQRLLVSRSRWRGVAPFSNLKRPEPRLLVHALSRR